MSDAALGAAAPVFRAVCPDDAATLLTLARAFHSEDGHPLDPAAEAAIARVCAGEPLAPCWLIELAGETVGYVVLGLGFSLEHGGSDGFVDDLYLVPQARGRGVGRAALAFAEVEARTRGVQTLHLEVEPANARAYRLYQDWGFNDLGRRLMSKRLAPVSGPEP